MIYRFYKILNKVNGKCYIGMTKRDINVRFNEHKRCAYKNHDINNHYITPIFNAMRKYGTDAFEILEIHSQDFVSCGDAEIMEGKLIAENMSLLSQNGYNLNRMNPDGTRTYETEVKVKIVKNNEGTSNPFYGKNHTNETKKILSQKAKLRFADPKNNPRYGYVYTEDDKAKHRESKKKFGRPFFAEGVLYQTLGEAATQYNLTKQAIKYRIDSASYEDWFYEKVDQ